MQTELEMLTARLSQLETEVALERSKNHRERRRLRIQATLAFVAFLAAVFALPANRTAIAQGYGVTLASLNTRLSAVEAKTQYQSVNTTAKSTTFSGCNVFINDGGGTTDTIVKNAAGAGLGNLTIGYNALQNGFPYQDLRVGSHNLIVGDYNNYNSYGGVVFGFQNTSLNRYAAVTGGAANYATGQCSSVSGGNSSFATGQCSSVSGGSGGEAGGQYASVSGGSGNEASGQWSSVSGGQINTASGNAASISGGIYNKASGVSSTVSGGGSNSIGVGVTQSNNNGWAAGGTGAGTYHSP